MLRSLLRRDTGVAALAPASGRAVVLVNGRRSAVTAELRRERPGLAVTEVHPGPDAWTTTAGVGPVDLLVDDTGDDVAAARDRFDTLFLLVAGGGQYVAPVGVAEELTALASSAGARKGAGGKRGTGSKQGGKRPNGKRARAAAMAAVDVGDRWVVVRRHGRSVVKLREAETTAVLAADPQRGAVLAGVDAASFESRCTFREMLPLSARVKEHYEAPPAVLRRYDSVVVAPHGLVVQRGVVPADSFRHHPQTWLTNDRLVDLDRRHSQEPPWVAEDLPLLEGAWYHLDNEHRGHFGHVLTEELSRVWAWDEAVRHEPDLRVLVGTNRSRKDVTSYEYTFFEAAGIPRDRVTVFEGRVRVERLLGATPLLSMPHYVHPHIVETWDRIGRHLRAQAPDRDYARRIFCSRKSSRRTCYNAREVDAFFARHGFEVVFPEEYSLPEQAAMFHAAEVVAGFAGSALFNVMFSDRQKHLVAVAAETYTPRNEYLISALRGHSLDMSLSRPDENDPMFHKQRFMSAFTFDFEREGRWLEDVVLPSLDA